MTKQIKDLTLEEIFKTCEARDYDCEDCDLNIGNMCLQKIFHSLHYNVDLRSYLEMQITQDEDGICFLAPAKLNDLERLLLKVFSNAEYVARDGDNISFWRKAPPEYVEDNKWINSNWVGGIVRPDNVFKFIPDKNCRKICFLKEEELLNEN